jgi:heat shock protein HslJ
VRTPLTVRIGLGLVLPVLLIAVACDGAAVPSGSSDGSRPATLAGTNWTVLRVGVQIPVGGAVPTIAFGAGQVSGTGGCNHFGGAYAYDARTGALRFDQIGMTAMACADDRRNRFETAFSGALVAVNRADLDADHHLLLSGPGGVIVLAPGDQPRPTD